MQVDEFREIFAFPWSCKVASREIWIEQKFSAKSCRKLLNLQSRKNEPRKFAQNVHARANLRTFLGHIFCLGRTKPYKSFCSRNVAIYPF